VKYTITALKDIYVRAFLSCNGPDKPAVEIDFPLRRKQSQRGVSGITGFSNSRKSLKASRIVYPLRAGEKEIFEDFASIEATAD
jgi:hypothetical protein